MGQGGYKKGESFFTTYKGGGEMILARLKGGHKRCEVSFIAKHLEF